MSLKDIEAMSSRQIDANRKKMTNEISRLQTLHENGKSELKKAQELELVQLRDDHTHRINEQNAKKEKVFEEMRKHLDSTRRLTDKELQDLKSRSDRARSEELVKTSELRDRLRSEQNLQLEQLNDDYRERIQDVNQQGRAEIEKMADRKSQEYIDKKAQLERKLSKQTATFSTQYAHDSETFKKLKDAQDRDFKRERQLTNVRQQQDLNKLTQGHSQVLEDRDKTFRSGIKDQDTFFERRYAEVMKAQDAGLKALEQRHEKVVEKMKSDLKQALVTSVERSDDPFYQFTELRPSVVHEKDKVIISVPVPEHGKQDLNLTTNNKTAILTFNRRYEDTKTNEDGTINKLNKVETFSARIPTEFTLNAKSVKSHYEDGEMIYEILRA